MRVCWVYYWFLSIQVGPLNKDLFEHRSLSSFSPSLPRGASPPFLLGLSGFLSKQELFRGCIDFCVEWTTEIINYSFLLRVSLCTLTQFSIVMFEKKKRENLCCLSVWKQCLLFIDTATGAFNSYIYIYIYKYILCKTKTNTHDTTHIAYTMHCALIIVLD